jgi:4-hydroxybutyrate CoA-transferase
MKALRMRFSDVRNGPRGAKVVTPERAAELVHSDDWIITGHSSASPRDFVQALVARNQELNNVCITHVRVEGPAEYLQPEYSSSFFHNACMLGPNSRSAMLEGRADYIPNRFWEMPLLLRNGYLKPRVAVLQLSPPDSQGYCSYGICTSYLPTAAEMAEITIGEINAQTPSTSGTKIHLSQLDYIIEADYPLYQSPLPSVGKVEREIARNVASLIDDGATLQMGIGAIPNAILGFLESYKDIGIHTEMFGNGVVELVEKGVITGRSKTLHPNKIIATFVMGTKKLFDFIHNNPIAEFYEVSYTNDPNVISRNANLVAINSAIEIDVTGQICSESIGSTLFTGVGGQLDFALGASLAAGGKFVIAIPSTAAKGKTSRIVHQLRAGAGVTTPRTLADYVVTEYGIASLRGKNLSQRARALIDICHPDFREDIEKKVAERKDIHL